MGVEWVEDVPPPKRHRRGKWMKVCEELRSKPYQWAKVHTGTNTAFAAALKKGSLGGATPGEFEATCRRTVDGKYDVYARYVGTTPADSLSGGSKEASEGHAS